LYVARTPERDRLRTEFKELGISTDVYWPETPHLQPAFADLGYGKESLPVTERLCDEVVSLPMFPELTEAEVERVCEALRG
ncbi:DegT/DnrJ/EryC1/StrS family aminotransferase, partial [Streptococcus pseudopneumoniae]|uniref:DegT/DnrJ/EryC1/StrS family aminotransferase n=1 Tax=Streptococcus pseudopneumoniae TaxID=257758 RepID=UPI0018B03175